VANARATARLAEAPEARRRRACRVGQDLKVCTHEERFISGALKADFAPATSRLTGIASTITAPDV